MKKTLCLALQSFSWLYTALILAWFAAYLLGGDNLPYLGLANLLAVYFFAPLPLVLLAGLLCRRQALLLGFAAGLLIFLGLWGRVFTPRLSPAQAEGPRLRVMTFNVLAWHNFTAPLLEVIRQEDPDVLFIQELNPALALALEGELGQVYPYRQLEPAGNPSGIGTLSKHPFTPVAGGGELPGQGWIGGPLLAEMEWQGQRVTLVNFHMLPTTGVYGGERTARDFRVRAEQARLLAELAQNGPAILAGDANSVPTSDAYQILTAGLQDAWAEAGWGLGHTFPGSSTSPGSDRPRLGGLAVPPWLARIDYIFCTQDWEVLSARLARVDGVSDHRGVVAELSLAR